MASDTATAAAADASSHGGGDAAGARVITLEEMRKHTTEESCWIAVRGEVFDVTPFIDEHPGGFDIIISNTGKDATEDFEEIGHSAAANEMLAKYKIGTLKGGDGGKAARKQAASAVATGAGGGGSSGAVKALQVLLPLLAVLAALLLPKLLAK